MKLPTRQGVGIVAGIFTAVALASTATLCARTLWPAYAAAAPTRSYSLAMLIARLLVGAICTATAAWTTTRIARDDGRAAWWLGGVFLAVSLPHHVFDVWAEYPVWYHLVYFAYLVPIAGITGRFAGSTNERR